MRYDVVSNPHDCLHGANPRPDRARPALVRLAVLSLIALSCQANTSEDQSRITGDTGIVRVVKEIGDRIWVGADKGLFYWQKGPRKLSRYPADLKQVYAIGGHKERVLVAAENNLIVLQ